MRAIQFFICFKAKNVDSLHMTAARYRKLECVDMQTFCVGVGHQTDEVVLLYA